MTRIREIRLKRAEGRTYLVDRDWRKFKSFSSANSYLRNISNTVEGGYDKTDLEIEWEDGEIYEGRMDVTASGGDTDIKKHVKDVLNYHKPKGYKGFIKKYLSN